MKRSEAPQALEMIRVGKSVVRSDAKLFGFAYGCGEGIKLARTNPDMSITDIIGTAVSEAPVSEFVGVDRNNREFAVGALVGATAVRREQEV